MNSPIEVILYDLGNVILPFNHFQIAQKLSPFSSKEEWKDPQKIFSYIFDSEKGVINDYEMGKVSSLRFFQSLKETLGLSLSFEVFAPIWNEIFVENPEVSDLIRSQKGKWRLGLLSNTNPLHFDYALSRFPIVHLFDRWILSHEVGFKKPSAEIFQRAMAWAGVPPEKVLFIDDTEGHVKAALSLGIRGIHFTSPQQLKEALSVQLKEESPSPL